MTHSLALKELPWRVEHAVTVLEREEIRGVTWDLDGWQMYPRQKAQYAQMGGFRDLDLLLTAIACFDGESAGYLQAWHHNVRRNDDGTILRDADGQITVKSTDLGWIQRNVVHTPEKVLRPELAASLASDLFYANPDLAKPLRSAEIAWQLFGDRGWQPWYAYSNGSYRRHLGSAALAVGNWAAFKEGLGPGYLVRA